MVKKNSGSDELGYGNIFFHDKNLQRFGFNLPQYSLIINPKFTGDTTKPGTGTRAVPVRIMDTNYYKQCVALRANKITDPRLYVCALQPWLDTCGNFDGSQKVPVSKCNNIGNQNDFYGWSFKKFTTMDKSLSAYNGCDASNIYILRLADVYLLYAEACMNSGDNDIALEYINKVHRRAYDVSVSSSSIYDYPGLTARTKAASDDADLAYNPLRYERHAELFAEGDWWFDICRWRIGASEAAYYSVGISDNSVVQWNDNRSYSFPIPGNEVSANPAVANEQNPGY